MITDDFAKEIRKKVLALLSAKLIPAVVTYEIQEDGLFLLITIHAAYEVDEEAAWKVAGDVGILLDKLIPKRADKNSWMCSVEKVVASTFGGKLGEKYIP